MTGTKQRTASRRSRRRGRGEKDEGYVLAMFALLLIPILIATALAVDVGSWYARVTQLQRAADAAALAGTIWMPDITKATSVAQDTLLKNGVDPTGAGGVTVTIGQGHSSTSLKVVLTDTKVKPYFSGVIGWNQTLHRSAEAEYYLPLPLGSPLNYFGGDASKSANIAASRSPGFWAAIGGPGDVAAYGDAYSAVCTGTADCGTPPQSNNMYRSTGYWYVIKMPATNPTTTTISIFDAAYNPSNGAANLAGDQSHVDSVVFTTEYRIYKQNSAIDINNRTPLTSSPSANDNSCYWQLTNNATHLGNWKPLCTITNPTAGDTYLLNVRTSDPQFKGSGVNGYAVQAIATGSVQPAVYAYGDMAMRNNINGTTATFYLSEVGPEFAGKVLNVDLWDPGDTNGTATLYPMMPSTTAVKPVQSVAQADCTYTASPSPNAASGSSADGGGTSPSVTTAHASDVSGSCGVITNQSGTNKYNDEWLHIRIKVPTTYTCTKGINPETTAGSCWWGIKYNFTAAANDVTTWKAAIEGNPVHLVQ